MKNILFILVPVIALLLGGCRNTPIDTPTLTATTTVTTTISQTPDGAPVQSQTGTKPTRPDITSTGGKPVPPLSKTTSSIAITSRTTNPVEIQKVLNLGLMVHLEGWNDGKEEQRFRLHASQLREYATLFEKYGAKLTLESKEMTDGAIQWKDNILLEMEKRGHGIGVHADAGGNANETTRSMTIRLTEIKSRLESLGVTVLHVSGVSSRADWVTASADTGFKFVTGTVAFALASLPPQKQPISIPPNAQPGQFHEAYPFTLEGRLASWRVENGFNWIEDTPSGRLVIIPSGSGMAYTWEETQGQTGLAGDQQFTAEDISAFEEQLKEIFDYIKTHESTQPYTYYLSWSFGKGFDPILVEQWLKMVDRYVDAGQIRWQTIPEMYDDYIKWEYNTGRR
jgi:hypothetical protein